MRPAKSVIQSGQQYSDEVNHIDELHDELLFGHLFLHLHPPLNQLGSVFLEISEGGEPGDQPNREIGPALPKLNGTRRNEQHRPEDNRTKQEPNRQFHPDTYECYWLISQTSSKTL